MRLQSGKGRRPVDAIRVGAFSPSVLLELARGSGRLHAAGLAVEELPVASSPAQFRDLLDGRLDAGLTSPDNVIAYRFSPANPLGGVADVRIVGAVDRGLGLALYARPGFDLQQLRAARFGVDVPTSGFALALYELAGSLGLARAPLDLVALGSTPRRLRALLAGECDVTMLNAGNDLLGEAAGCVRLAAVSEVCPPYLGTVVAVAGTARLGPARRLAAVLAATGRAVVAGELAQEARAVAARRLDLTPELAARYVENLCDAAVGVVPDGVADTASLRTLVRLRRTYLPEPGGAGDVVDAALDPRSGLLDAGAAAATP